MTDFKPSRADPTATTMSDQAIQRAVRELRSAEVAATETVTVQNGTNVFPDDVGEPVRVLDGGSAVRKVEDLARDALGDYLPEGVGIATQNGEFEVQAPAAEGVDVRFDTELFAVHSTQVTFSGRVERAADGVEIAVVTVNFRLLDRKRFSGAEPGSQDGGQ
jgi:predicted thioesterase